MTRSRRRAAVVRQTRPAPDEALPRTTNWRRELVILGFITSLAWALRLVHLAEPSLRGDEAFGYFFARQPIGDMLRAMIATEPHPPLFYLAFGAWLKAAGSSEFSLRLFSVAFGTLAVPLIAVLGRRLFGPGAGWVAAAWLAWAPLEIWNSQDARMFTLAVALTIATTRLEVDLIDAARRREPFDRRIGAAYVILTLIALFSLYHTAFVVIFQNLAALIWLRRPRSAAFGWLALQAALAVIYGPWLVVARHALFGHGGNGSAPGFWGGLTDGFGALAFGETLPPELRAGLALAGAIALLATSLRAAWLNPRTLAFAGLYFLVPFLIVIVLALVRPVYQPRYLIPAQPGLALLLGAGLVAIWQPARHRSGALFRLGAALALIGLVLGADWVALRNYWFDPRYAKAAGWREATNYIKTHFQPGDFAILNVPDPSFGYYFQDDRHSAVLPESAPVDPVATGNALARLAAEHPRLWLVPFQSPTWDADGFVERWLNRATHPLERPDFPSVKVRLYDTALPGLATAHPVGIAFADGLALRADQVTWSTTESGVLEVTLYWQATAQVTTDYTVFTHLESAAGQVLAQQDNPPQAGTYPTTRWLPGETVRDTYHLKIDPTQPLSGATLQVGFYDPTTGQRLARRDGGDRVQLNLPARPSGPPPAGQPRPSQAPG